MATGRGYAGLLGVGSESTWGTEVVATQRVPFLSESITDVFTMIQDESLEGKQARRYADQGPEDLAGTIDSNFRYTNSQLLLSAFFGQLTAGKYTMLETTESVSRTLAIEKVVSVHTYTGVKVNQITIAGTPTDRVTIAYDVIAKDAIRTSVTNTSGVLSALTDTAENILFTELNFRIGDLVDALVVGDEMGISAFELMVNRNLDQVHTNQSRLVIEPLENGRREGTFKITIPRYQAQTFLGWKDSHTKLQARLNFTNGTNTKEILLPEMLITSVDPLVSGPELYPLEVEMMLFRDQSNSILAINQEIEINET
jgi:hypothetical protein